MVKHRFRKVYFVCEDNSVMSEYSIVDCFRKESNAKEQAIYRQRKAMEDSTMLWNEGESIPKFEAHGFYLVHESLFDEILKEHSK